jgi:uncharacterized protein
MSTPETVFQPEPTQDERTMAMLAHALQVVGWLVAPLVIFLVKRESRFVAFHALQAVLLQSAVVVFWVIIMSAFFASMIGTMGTNPPQNAPPAILFMFPLIWLGAMGAWIAVLVCAIVYSIKAGRGEWAGYPLLGRLARRILNLPAAMPTRPPETH